MTKKLPLPKASNLIFIRTLLRALYHHFSGKIFPHRWLLSLGQDPTCPRPSQHLASLHQPANSLSVTHFRISDASAPLADSRDSWFQVIM